MLEKKPIIDLKTLLLFISFLYVHNLALGQYYLSTPKKNASIKNTDFDIVSVEFDTKSTFVGQVFTATKQKQNIGFRNSVSKSIEDYYKLYNSGKKVKVKIIVKDFSVTETISNENNISGNIKYELEAYFENEEKSTKFCNSRNSAKYSRTLQASMLPNVEKQITETLDNGLKFVIGYIKNSKSNLEAFATDYKVIIKPFFVKPTIDTVYYQQRKVTWEDFNGPVRNNHQYGAAIFTSFGFDSKLTVENNVIIAEITPKVYTDKNMSWAKPEIKNAHALSHEQLHFDICYLNTLRFLQKIKTFKEPTQNDLISRIQYEYLEFYRTTHKMQTQYDEETNHSLIKPKQKEWEDKIRMEIKHIDTKEIFN